MQVEEKAGLPLATWYRTMRWLQRVPQAAALHLSQSQGFEHSEGGQVRGRCTDGASGGECMLTAATVSSALMPAWQHCEVRVLQQCLSADAAQRWWSHGFPGCCGLTWCLNVDRAMTALGFCCVCHLSLEQGRPPSMQHGWSPAWFAGWVKLAQPSAPIPLHAARAPGAHGKGQGSC